MLTSPSLFDLPHPVKGDVAFPLLAAPDSYVACQWDLEEHPEKRAHWIGLFRTHFDSLEQQAIAEATERGESADAVKPKLAIARELFMTYLDQIEANPTIFGTLYIIQICFAREKALREAGIADPYRLAKAKENEAALKLLPALFEELDSLPDPEKAQQVMRGTFAGNIYDLGATKTVELFKDGKPVDFHDVRNKLAPRPWLVDGLDAWSEKITSEKPYTAAAVFVDNAGCDVILGMIPFVRDLLQRDIKVVLTSNSYPALNDITHSELVPIINSIAQWDQTISKALADDRLRVVPSGNGAPLIDLAHVGEELVDSVNELGVDLVVLEGMGRAIESNLNAQFTCDSLNIAMIKDTGVASALGGKVYDLLCKYQQK
ncbi:MAG: ARMT1-like domain-containing protein [Phycisphaeraceae bacterium JB051]